MKSFTFMFLCRLVLGSRLNFNSSECSQYLKKFQRTNQTIPTSLAFSGEPPQRLEDKYDQYEIYLRYLDPLYDDEKYFGLTQEDGKSANTTCLDLKLFKFSNSDYSDGVQITDLPITSRSNNQKQWRYLVYSLNLTDIPNKLIQTQNSNRYIYIGYYAIAYFAAGTNNVQYTFYFQFSISMIQDFFISSTFIPYNQFETQGCTLNKSCRIRPSSILKWCTDITCEVNAMPNFYIYDQYYLQQIVTVSGLQNYYLTDTTILFLGNGLQVYSEPIMVDNSIPGKATILLALDVLWNNVTIQVTSYLSTTKYGSRLLSDSFRFDQETKTTQTYDPVVAFSDTINCIKPMSDTLKCSTCTQQCDYNRGYSMDGCEKCTNNDEPIDNTNQLILITMLPIYICFCFYLCACLCYMAADK